MAAEFVEGELEVQESGKAGYEDTGEPFETQIRPEEFESLKFPKSRLFVVEELFDILSWVPVNVTSVVRDETASESNEVLTSADDFEERIHL